MERDGKQRHNPVTQKEETKTEKKQIRSYVRSINKRPFSCYYRNPKFAFQSNETPRCQNISMRMSGASLVVGEGDSSREKTRPADEPGEGEDGDEGHAYGEFEALALDVGDGTAAGGTFEF